MRDREDALDRTNEYYLCIQASAILMSTASGNRLRQSPEMPEGIIADPADFLGGSLICQATPISPT
ncbi:MAG: hypothetical protein ACOYES_11895 [Bacillota bacterium]